MGVVHIQGTQSGQYLAMDTNGLLYGSVGGRMPWEQTGQGWRAADTSKANHRQ